MDVMDLSRSRDLNRGVAGPDLDSKSAQLEVLGRNGRDLGIWLLLVVEDARTSSDQVIRAESRRWEDPRQRRKTPAPADGSHRNT